MSKVITFSRVFPAYHPKAGQPTYFVEKIWKSLDQEGLSKISENFSEYGMTSILYHQNKLLTEPKRHTIRKGNRWKVGDKFSPRVWSDKPYRSKQIIIAPDIEIKKVWEFEVIQTTEWECDWYINGNDIDSETYKKLAANDGLNVKDMSDWFIPDITKVKSRIIFKGQIICWSDSVNY